MNGQPHIGQRYAIDWIQLGDDGKSFTGDEHDNSSYHAWDQEIHAVADGKIVEVKDGIPENVPNSGKIAVQITYDTLAGNHIIEELSEGHYAAYAHLRPGTIKVKVGDTVHAGDVLAHLGNTGNSIGAASAFPGLRRAVVPGLGGPAIRDRSVHVRRLQDRQSTEAGTDDQIVASDDEAGADGGRTRFVLDTVSPYRLVSGV